MKRVLAPLALTSLLLCCTDDAATDAGTASPTNDGGVSPSTDAGNDASGGQDATPGDAEAGAPTDPRDGPGVFAGVGNFVRHVRSLDDGMTWVDDVTDLTTADGTGDEIGIRTTVYLDNQFIAFAARMYTSPDGKTWTRVTKADGQWLASMVYAQGQYVSSGGYGWLATTTNDLGTWTQHPPHADYTAAHHSRAALAHGLVDGKDAYVVVDDNGDIFHASDGKTWMTTTGTPAVPAGPTWGTVFAYGDGVFVGLLPDGKGTIRSSDGGATWSANTPFATQAVGLVFAQKHFTAIGSGHVFTSTDGQAWSDQAAPNAPAGDVTYGHGVYLVLEGNGKVHRSTNLSDWSVVLDTPANPNTIASIAFGPK